MRFKALHGGKAARAYRVLDLTWQLQHDRQRASGRNHRQSVLQATSDSRVFEDQGRVHQLHRLHIYAFFGKIDAMKFQTR